MSTFTAVGITVVSNPMNSHNIFSVSHRQLLLGWAATNDVQDATTRDVPYFSISPGRSSIQPFLIKLLAGFSWISV